MSNEATSWAVRQKCGGTGPKLLLMVLANHAGKDGICYPGRELLAEECDTKRTATITANFARLESMGFVKRIERRRKNTSRTSDWAILAPCADDRGEMINATDDRPEAVRLLAVCTDSVPEVRSALPESSGTDEGGGQVRNSGSPEPEEKRSGETSDTARAEIDEVWDHYRQAVDRPKAKLHDRAGKNVKTIASALELVGLERVKLAITGLSLSPHHNGENDAKTKYLDIRYALRGIKDETDEDKIERMIGIAKSHGATPASSAAGAPRVDPARIERRLEAIRACKSSGGTHEPERAEQAVRELEGWGYTIEYLDEAPWARLTGNGARIETPKPAPAPVVPPGTPDLMAALQKSLAATVTYPAARAARAAEETMVSRETLTPEKPELI